MPRAIDQQGVELGVTQHHQKEPGGEQDPTHRVTWIAPGNQETHPGKRQGGDHIGAREPKHLRPKSCDQDEEGTYAAASSAAEPSTTTDAHETRRMRSVAGVAMTESSPFRNRRGKGAGRTRGEWQHPGIGLPSSG